MKNSSNSVPLLITIFLAIAVVFVFFLPAAISMNTSTGEEAFSNFNPAAAQGGREMPFAENKNGSLSLRTAAIVGSSAANAAVALIGNRNSVRPH